MLIHTYGSPDTWCGVGGDDGMGDEFGKLVSSSVETTGQVTEAHTFVLRLMDPDIGTAGDAMKLMRLAIINQLNDTALNDRRVRVRVTLNQISIPMFVMFQI